MDKLRKDNASTKDIEKAELKLKKAQDDYKVLVDKYSAVKEDFEKKMTSACKVKIIKLNYIHFNRTQLYNLYSVST